MTRVFQAIQYGALGIVGLPVPAYLMAPSAGVGLDMGIYCLSSAFVVLLLSYTSFCIKLPTSLALLSFFLPWQFTYWLVAWLGTPDTWGDSWTLTTFAALAGSLVVVPLLMRATVSSHPFSMRAVREEEPALAEGGCCRRLQYFRGPLSRASLEGRGLHDTEKFSRKQGV